MTDKTDRAKTAEFTDERTERPAPAAIVGDPLSGRAVPTGNYRRMGAYSPKVPAPVPAPRQESAFPTGGLIHKAEILAWPQRYNYYQRFCQDAERFFSLGGEEAPAVPFFSYIPQYSQLTKEQAAFYLWFRENLRAGTPISGVDLSYLLLYVYEVINLPEKISPAKGAALLSVLWLFYRREHPELDRYLVEWMCDYCLCRGVPLPESLLPILPEILPKATLKEFYISSLMEKTGGFSPEVLLLAASDYDYRSSKRYEEHKEAFDTRIPKAVFDALATTGDLPDPTTMRKVRVERDAYCGSLCAQSVKRRILIEYSSFARSFPLRRTVTAAVKLAENALRRELKIRSRLKTEEADPRLTEALAAAFPAVSRKKDAPEDTAYERLYDAPDTGIDYSAARQMESVWLEVEEEQNAAAPAASAPAPDPAPAMETDPAPTGVPYPEALRAAFAGESFAAFVRARGLRPAACAGAINDYAFDVLGDVVLTETEGDFSPIYDYKEDVLSWLM